MFLLREYGGLSFKEIAVVQRCRLGTALARMRYAVEDPDIREHFVRSNKAAAKQRLQKALGLMFDADMSQKQLQVKKMEGEIVKLREKIAKHRSAKDKIIQKRLERMTGEGDDWDW